MQTVEEVEWRLGEVAVLLPFLVARLPRLRAPLVLELARDPGGGWWGVGEGGRGGGEGGRR